MGSEAEFPPSFPQGGRWFLEGGRPEGELCDLEAKSVIELRLDGGRCLKSNSKQVSIETSINLTCSLPFGGVKYMSHFTLLYFTLLYFT